jgi:hypothetical protein
LEENAGITNLKNAIAMNSPAIRLLSCILLLCPVFITGQIQAQSIVSGQVTDLDTGKPVPYVSIFLRGDQSLGVMSNEEGNYRFAIPIGHSADEIVFSSLGYQTVSIPVRTLHGPSRDVQMQKSFIELDEVIVLSDLGLRGIVQKALNNIEKNYGSDRHYLQTYFRRYTLTDGKHSHIKEGFFTIEDGRYEGKRKDVKIWMQHYRESDDFRSVRWLDDREGVNFLFHAYQWFNALRRHRIHYMANDFAANLDNYTFSHRGTYLENGDSLIRIAYNLIPNEEVLRHTSSSQSFYLYEGEMLINLSDYAIVRNTVGQGREDYFQDLIYVKKNGRYYPQRFQFTIEVSHGPYGVLTHKINSLFYFHHVAESKEEIKKVKKGRRLSKEIPIEANTVKYDPEFWANDNTMIRMDLPSALEADLSRMSDLDQQYRRNAKN